MTTTSNSTPDPSDEPGSQPEAAQGAARYRFGELIATGGMGEVWRAVDTALDRQVAIKLLKPEYAEDPVNRARFDSEAQHAAALHHPHIAAVYDVGEMPTASGLMRPYMVMEFIDGQPLSDIITAGEPLAADVVRDILGQTADAIAAAHRAGIIHRDIKPANLLITREGQVKVTDFGIARAASSSAVTGTGQVMGTPQYLSPEQARGDVATPASDVYSLGIVAYECLTGVRPFQKETPVATAIAQIYDAVPPLPDTVPADLTAVVLRALAKDPAERYPDAAAFAAALRGIDAGRTGTPVNGIPAVEVPPAPVAPPVAEALAASVLDVPTPELAATQAFTPPVADAPVAESVTAVDGAPVPPATETEERRVNWLLISLLIAVAVVLIAVVVMAVLVFRNPSDSKTPATVTSSSPAATTSTAPADITLDPSQYVGHDLDEVLNNLRTLGLNPNQFQIGNDGTHDEGTVADITPLTGLTKGSNVTVHYYGDGSSASAAAASSAAAAAASSAAASQSAANAAASASAAASKAACQNAAAVAGAAAAGAAASATPPGDPAAQAAASSAAASPILATCN